MSRVSRPRYDLLALDLDGTVFNSKGEITPATRQAVRLAREAGMRVILCTGRGLIECRHAVEGLDQTDPVIVAGGSIIADPVSGRTLHRFALDRPLVARAVDRLLAHDHPAMVLKDPQSAGYDYLIVRGPKRLPLDPVTEWWFDKLNVRATFADHLDEDAHPEHTVRVGACGLSGRMAEVRAALHEACGKDSLIHHFPAVIGPEHTDRLKEGQTVDVLEMFHLSANKWGSIRVLAERFGVPPERIAAIGDEVNDVAMIRSAACGIAMGNAAPAVKEVAKHQTRSNNEDGVAHAIGRILGGEW